MATSWKIASSVLYLMFLVALGSTISVPSPPTIIRHPNPEITIKPGDDVEIPCIATGEPSPLYTWKKNDQPLAIDNIFIKQLPGLGTIVLESVHRSYRGVYQCIATNNFGSALSIKTILNMAVLEPFPSLKEPKIHRPIVGMPLTFHCQPPLSYPQSIVYWGESRDKDRLKAIDSTDRISLDYEGNLYFANVLAEDAKGGSSYICIVLNMELSSLVQGDNQKIDPQPISGAPRYEPPKLMWPLSNTIQVALKGETKKMKCIFSGYPTPSVNWTRVDAPLPSKVIINSYGKEIRIPYIDYSDVGSYKCTGTNNVSEASGVVTLRVESQPYWKNGIPPEDIHASMGDGARFDCQAIGQPKPKITWFINGIPVQELPLDPRRSITGDSLVYRNVTMRDVQVIQCNASNVHGYVFANAILNVIVPSVAPVFQIIERGSHHMKLAWEKPDEPNGTLFGYDIEYRKAPPAVDHIKLLKILNSEQKHMKIRDLEDDTAYTFHIYALTETGRGPAYYIQESTLPSFAPSQPILGDIVFGEGSANVSWIPVADTNEPPHNPGDRFLLEYRKAGSEVWQRTVVEFDHNWINVTDLEKEGVYEFRVVAMNSARYETKSEPKTVSFISEEDVKPNMLPAGWIIGIIVCAIAFLLLTLVLIFLIKRNCGGRNKAHKRNLKGYDSTKTDDETGFGEYTRTGNVNKS